MLKDAYSVVMDSDRNPLMALPRIVRFQIMTILSFMWSIIFTLWTQTMVFFGEYVLGHILLLVGIFATIEVFKRAQHRQLSQNMLFKNKSDG